MGREGKLHLTDAERAAAALPAGPLPGLRLAEAMREAIAGKKRQPELVQAAPTGPDNRPAAFSPDPCARCGIPGFRGCAHQKPYQREAGR